MEPEKTRALYLRGTARWPELPLSFEQFHGQVGPHFEKLAGLEESRICAEDLFLVAACLQRLPGAVERFDELLWPRLERHLRQKEQDPHRLAEIRQTLLVRLFVPRTAAGAPRIAEYTGRGPLLVWLRMTASRLLLDERRDNARVTDLGASYGNIVASLDVELSFIRGRYEEHFAIAMRTAVSALGEDDRLLLQLRYREELTSDQIALLLKTSRVTAHRRVVAAREALTAQLREELRTRLELSASGLEQVMGLWSSSLVPALSAELKQALASKGEAADTFAAGSELAAMRSGRRRQ